MAKQVEQTYGDALFSVAVEENRIDEFYEEAAALVQILRENEDLIRLFEHPHIDKDEKQRVIENTFSGRISDEITGTVSLMVEKDHGGQLIGVLEYFMKRVKKHKNIGLALVTSAVPLSSAQKAAIEMKLIDTTPYRSIEAAYRVDESIIGGLVIRIDDRVCDSSIKTKLFNMQREVSR